MLAITWLALGMAPPIVWAGYSHVQEFGVVNWTALALILFLHINLLICVWELCLCYRHTFIRSVVEKRGRTRSKTLEPIILFRHASLSEVLSPTFWAYVWIDYARYDPSYSEPGSCGYNVDVGNGHVTLIPSAVLLWSIISPLASARVLGTVGVVLYWQLFYGTIIYGYSYFNLQRYKNTSWAEIVACVLFPNSIWIFFPILGFWVSYQMIFSDSMCALQDGCAA